MNRRTRILHLMIGLLTIVLVVGGFTSFQRKRSSFDRLDFHWIWRDGVIHVDRVDAGSGADQAGLRVGDQIWVVDGIASTELDGLKNRLKRPSPVPMVVARDGQTLALLYTPPQLKIDHAYLFLTLIGFLYLAIGLFTLFRGARGESSLFYLVTLLAFVVYVYSPAGEDDSTFRVLYLIEEMARIFLPPLTLHFFLRFPRPLTADRRVLVAIYAIPVLLALWVADLFIFGNVIPLASLETSVRIIDRWEMLHFAVYFTLSFIALAYTYRTAPAAGQRKQIKWIYLGMGVGFIPFLVLYLIPFVRSGSGSGYTTIAILPLALIPLAFAVSILRYKLWDVEVVIKEVLAYTVTFIFGMIAFSTVNVFLSSLLEEHLALERNFLAFASGLLIAGVLVPVKGRIENLFEMILYRDTYRHRRAMTDFARELSTFHDLHELIESIRERLGAAIQLEQLNLYVREADSLLLFNPQQPLPRIIRESELGVLPAGRPLLLGEPRLPDDSDLSLQLLRSGYRYVFALRHRNELQGLLLCGNKREEEPLSRDDLQLVSSITAPLALAIENARLYGRLRRQLDQIQLLKEFNENIIESSSSAIVVVNATGIILTANRAFWSLIGATPDSMEPIDTLFPPYLGLRDTPEGSREVSFRNRLSEEKELSITIGPFTAPDAPTGTRVLVIGDITDRVHLERELQEKERLAALGLLAAGVAHEVNTPLTGISSYAQLLLSDLADDDPRYAILKKMELQTFRASHLVNNLLDFAASRNRSAAERIDLAETIRTTLSLHEVLFKGKDIRIHVEPSPPLFVRGNVHELQQVLTNLLLNARDAVERGGNVWIALGTAGDNAVMAVRDDGKGVAPEDRERIFQPLVTSKRGQGGTGLGLAICEKIVKQLGGHIELESEPGHGATFSVVLPLWETTKVHPDADQEGEREPGATPRT
ncbi:MAG TPA: ATP-binding protein [Thermoanaerobaculia bacterium]|nr:ATP-binding protein [Thermoanaerobaculia bacterium]